MKPRELNAKEFYDKFDRYLNKLTGEDGLFKTRENAESRGAVLVDDFMLFRSGNTIRYRDSTAPEEGHVEMILSCYPTVNAYDVRSRKMPQDCIADTILFYNVPGVTRRCEL